MRYLRSPSLLKLVVLPFTLSLWLAACTSYKTLSPPYAESIVWENPDAVRVTLHDETQIELAQPTCAGDTLVGLDYNWDRDSDVHTRSVRVALTDVSSIEKKSSNSTLLAIVPIAVIVAVMVNAADPFSFDLSE